MANTYTQIHLQLIFAVKYRAGLILPSWKERLHQYTTGIIQGSKHKILAVNSMPDHIHIFGGFRPSQSVSSLIQNVKTETTKWIKREKLAATFAWQDGFGAFSYSKSHVDQVVKYVLNQEEHHKKKTFLEEYRDFLKAFDIDYEEQYIFKEPI